MTREERRFVFLVSGLSEEETEAALRRGEKPRYGMRYTRELVERLRAFGEGMADIAKESRKLTNEKTKLLRDTVMRRKSSPPEGDTVSALSTSFRLVMSSVYLMCKDGRGNEAADMLAERAIAALQSRVSPQAGMRPFSTASLEAICACYPKNSNAYRIAHNALSRHKAELDAEGGE